MKKTFKHTYVCPYCFETFDLHGVQFRCSTDPKHCSPENDPVLAKFSGVSKIVNKVVNVSPPSNFIGKLKAFFTVPTDAVCHACGESTSNRICPACHSELPYTVGEHKNLIFAVIGGKDAGKSHYISVLIDKIKNEMGSSFDCHLQPLNDATIKRYRNDFYKPVFSKREIIQATRSARADKNVRTPLIYTLSFMEKGWFDRKRTRAVVTIVFFDTAGEDLNAEDTIITENKYIYNSEGIILLLDPLQLAFVRANLPPGTPLPVETGETEDLLVRVINLVRKAKRLKSVARINIPIAVAFSKIDGVEPLLDASSCLKYTSKHDSEFNMDEFESVNGEMEALIREWSGGGSLIKPLEHGFNTYAFFGLSALGCNPHASKKIDKLRPVRVEEPFLWLLSKYGLISRSNMKSWEKLFFHIRMRPRTYVVSGMLLGLLSVFLLIL